MYTRLVILSVIVVGAVCGLGGLGYHAIEKWAQGLEGARLGEFAEVAEQVRQDVKRKLDEFVRAEQQRKYTDYLYSYVPENVATAQEQLPLLRSPLGDQWSNDFAYGYFQIEPDGSIVTPYYPGTTPELSDNMAIADEAQRHRLNIGDNVLPAITYRSGTPQLPADQVDQQDRQNEQAARFASAQEKSEGLTLDSDTPQLAKGTRSKNYAIESLQKEAQEPQVFTQQRQLVMSNQAQAYQPPPPVQSQRSLPQQATVPQGVDSSQVLEMGPVQPVQAAGSVKAEGLGDGEWANHRQSIDELRRGAAFDAATQVSRSRDAHQGGDAADMVQIRVEPFVPLVVPGTDRTASIFGGQVFLLRHVQIEDKHILQGFQLDEHTLVEEVEASARLFMREGMGFDLPQVRAPAQTGDARDTAYTAVLDFGFGDLVLDLYEMDPAWIVKRIGELHRIYVAIIATVLGAVALALVSLWHNVRAQVRLARKKDDFISAVSHELRTPLTSIRMYTEMLEKGWVKSQDKLGEYYRNMRQESERLSRLVENVLDFARLQKGRRQYAFQLGNVDDCIAEVVEMMRPYAQQHGFTIHTQLGQAEPTPFDRDAVTQIVVNLIDNAVKYARVATDKTIIVRTRSEDGFTILEVEDRGPGIPHRRRKKVFREFYRIESGKCEVSSAKSEEAPPTSTFKLDTANSPQPTGTGLGLTLVKRFAEAHNGYVEIDSAHPTGALFRVALATHLPTTS